MIALTGKGATSNGSNLTRLMVAPLAVIPVKNG
jgi:hypothetical protein